MKFLIRLACLTLAGCVFALPVAAQLDREYISFEVDQSRGVDPSVDYSQLTKFGPWDDRNYDLTTEDLSYLAPDEAQISDPIPAFFRVLLRKNHPYLSVKPGKKYPRSAVNTYRQRYGGYLVNGWFYRGVERIDGEFRFVEDSRIDTSDVFTRFLSGEVRVTNPIGAAESAVSISPVDPDIVVAGTNGPGGGQKMHYSTDGGETWTQGPNLPLGGTCCDPTVDWSIDGSKVYAATLGNCGFGGCAIWFYRSDDQGQTYNGLENDTPGDPRRELTTSGSDKEYLHVDRWPGSPHADNVYLTWHDGNTMQFARSTDFGVTFDPTISFGSEPLGIGSDIATDKSGDIYYIYPAFNAEEIRLLKSTDGGASFAAGSQIAPTNDGFDFPLPSMETRNAFIYVAADVDFSGGPFDDSIYAAWTDLTGPEGSAANNHARIQVAFSRDGGATWTVTTPHSTADMNDVDRYHPWLSVDDNGNVHVVYYDTRDDRTSVDFHYTFSDDGGVTWATPVRLTDESSPNIADGFEFGDYNGMDIRGPDSISVWTDNRDEDGGGNDSVDVYAAGSFAQVGDTFTLSADPGSFDVCTPDSVVSTITANQIGNFNESVDLSATVPTGFSNESFTVDPVTPPAMSDFSVDVGGGAAVGLNTVTIQGVSTSEMREIDIDFLVFDAVPGMPNLTSPPDDATGISTSAMLSWDALTSATSYMVEVDDNSDFSSPEFTATTADAQVTATGLQPTTEYFWRITAENSCGAGTASATFSFTTSNQYCSAPGAVLLDPDNGGGSVFDTIAATGGTVDSVEVQVDLGHTFVGDTRAVLTHVQSGTSVTLYDRPGVPASQFGCSGQNVLATFTDSASVAAEDECQDAADPALSGSFLPVDPLSDFQNLPITSDWQLEYYDDEAAGTDEGVLNSWCVNISELTEEIFADGFEDPIL